MPGVLCLRAVRAPKNKYHQSTLALLALGVVFGDIGTSPLYAFETALVAAGATSAAAIGVASLIVWTLFLVVTLKYVALVMRADFEGEGGIFALMALLRESPVFGKAGWGFLSVLIIIGAALLFGDGAITPAISVLSAVEGLSTFGSGFAGWTVPITVTILILLFGVQRFGTGRLGGIFGPVMAVWFLCLAGLGLVQIFQRPEVLSALNPLHGIGLLINGGWGAWALVGAVVLAVTGAEALYADLGHFGRPPILRAWRWVVFPSLILNYLGQAALVLRLPEAATDPNLFFLMAPDQTLRGGLVVLATLATIIASQALISGVFSLSSQAIDLGYLPRFFVKHTSSQSHGQIYIPVVNMLLGIACVMLVLGFRSSEALASAYGIAVTGAMVITTVAFVVVVHVVWRRPLWQTGLLLLGLLAIDLPLFLACLSKLLDGGMVPILLAGGVAVTMMTWHRGWGLVRRTMSFGSLGTEELGRRLATDEFQRVTGTQVFVVRKPSPEHAVASILEQYRRVRVIGERVVILLLDAGWESPFARCLDTSITKCEGGLWVIYGSHGYMVEPDVPAMMTQASAQAAGEFPFEVEDTFFVVARYVILSCPKTDMPPWQRRYFGFMSRNIAIGPHVLNIPADRLILYNWLLRLEQ